MNDELEALLRDHYRAAADHVTAGPGTVRRFQDAGRAVRAPERTRWRWAFPVLAAAVTAAVLVTIALLLWPGGGQPVKPRPMAPPASPAAPGQGRPVPGTPAPGPAEPPTGGPSPSRSPVPGATPGTRRSPGAARGPRNPPGASRAEPSPSGTAPDRPFPTSTPPGATPTHT
ncbi:hypothetical protein [Actinomadura opuntiae]|uniref:hypothetical protein n=1 Tax=Actinomadura sp. OS1-43 TaxID=604315 RepID=UPI00255B01D6|nr:hypothetical protein [Actinomadura sp. OS1-43]MDL4821983.1 hypothetical protein [Actinomadura sp. OS1-43]